MLTIGLTGGTGSGKSTVAGMFARHGAHILCADSIARHLMRPGEPVFNAIVKKFGHSITRPDGSLDRPALARLAFKENRVEDLNAIVHPATIAAQEQQAARIAEQHPDAVIIVESALIFETRHSRGWRLRFDKLILVRASESAKVANFIHRSLAANPHLDPAHLEADVRDRLSKMIADDKKAQQCDFVIMNDGTLDRLEEQTARIWTSLQQSKA